jgi:hypothetical protein
VSAAKFALGQEKSPVERFQAKHRFAAKMLQVASNTGTSLDFAQSPWYLCLMTTSVCTVNRKHMSRFGWAMEGVVR